MPPGRSAMSSAGPSAGVIEFCMNIGVAQLKRSDFINTSHCSTLRARENIWNKVSVFNLHVLRAECPWPIEDYINICFLYYISERYN